MAPSHNQHGQGQLAPGTSLLNPCSPATDNEGKRNSNSVTLLQPSPSVVQTETALVDANPTATTPTTTTITAITAAAAAASASHQLQPLSTKLPKPLSQVLPSWSQPSRPISSPLLKRSLIDTPDSFNKKALHLIHASVPPRPATPPNPGRNTRFSPGSVLPQQTSSFTNHYDNPNNSRNKSLSLLGLPRPLISSPSPVSPTPVPSGFRPAATFSSPTTPLKPLQPPSIQEFQRHIPSPLPPVSRHRVVHPSLNDSTFRSSPSVHLNSLTLPAQSQPQPSIAAAATPTIVQQTESVPWSKSGHLFTGFTPLDLQIARLSRLHDHPPPSNRTSTPPLEPVNPLIESVSHPADPTCIAPGSFLETIGPPGSGKTLFCLQMAIHERIRSLVECRHSMSMEDQHLDEEHTSTDEEDGTKEEEERQPSRPGAAQTHRQTTPPPKPSSRPFLAYLFEEEFWDAELTKAHQVLLIDTEGGLLPERILDAVWAHAIRLWRRHVCFLQKGEMATDANLAKDEQNQQGEAQQDDEEGKQEEEEEEQDTRFQRDQMPEVVRRVVRAILAGLHVSRVTRLAQLVALLVSLRPTHLVPSTTHGSPSSDDNLEQQQQPSPCNPYLTIPSALPDRTSLIIIDSLSHPLRLSPSNSTERRSRQQMSDRIQQLLLPLVHPFYRLRTTIHHNNSFSPIQPVLVITNQTTVKSFSLESSVSNTNSNPGSILVPQLLFFSNPNTIPPNGVWKLVLFRSIPIGSRFIQIVSIPSIHPSSSSSSPSTATLIPFSISNCGSRFSSF